MYIYAEIKTASCINIQRNSKLSHLFRVAKLLAANTRVLSGLRKWLSVSGLHFPAIRRSPYYAAKWPISHSDMAHFVPRYAQYRTMIKPIS